MSYIGVASGCSVGCAECLMERCFVKVYKVEQQVGICRSVTAKLLNVTHALEDLRSGSGACSTEGCTSISSTSPSAVRSIIRITPIRFWIMCSMLALRTACRYNDTRSRHREAMLGVTPTSTTHVQLTAGTSRLRATQYSRVEGRTSTTKLKKSGRTGA